MKTRLNQYMRDRLIEHARSLIATPEEDEEEREALLALKTLASERVAGAFPEADMRVLARYGVAAVSSHLRISSISMPGRYGRDVPLSQEAYLPNRMHSYDLTLLPDDPLIAAYERYECAFQTKHVVRKQRLQDYEVLIKSVRNVEDVLEVWPEAEELYAKFRCANQSAALSTLNADVVARIRADVASRRQEVTS